MTVISNATPLIYLAKLGKLRLLKDLFEETLIPKEGYREVVVIGKREGYSDAMVVEEGMEKGWIKVVKVEVNRIISDFAQELDKGEVEVISLAREHEDALVLIDDAAARKIAASLDLNVKGTIYVLLKGYKNKLLSKNETKELLFKLVSAGFRLSPELLGQLLKILD